MAKGHILIIDDEEDILELVRYNLEQEGYRVEGASDGESGLKAAIREMPDLVLVDLMLPGMDGLEVCRHLRSNNRTASIPVIMLTAKSAESDRVVGLELGADDYVTKPFSPRELAARVKAVLRRMHPARLQTDTIRRRGLLIDRTRRQVCLNGSPIDLTATEFRLLQFLAEHPGRVFSRSELIDAALGTEISVTNRTVDVHITGLRKKLGPSCDLVETVRGFGYRFREDGEFS